MVLKTTSMVHPFDGCYLISLRHGESDKVQYLVIKEQKPKLWPHMTASTTFTCPGGRREGTGKRQLRHELVSLCDSCTAALLLQWQPISAEQG